LHQLQKDWPAAIALLKQVRRDAPDYKAVLQAIEGCYRSWAAEGRPAGRSRAELMREAAGWFQQVAAAQSDLEDKKLGPVEQFAVLAAARGLLDESLADYQGARELLSAALAASPSAPADWTTAARTLLVLAQAGCGDIRQASNTLGGLDGAQGEQLLATIEGLSRLTARAAPTLRKQLAEVQLQALDKLLASGTQLRRQERLRTERLRAQALADAGRTDEALRAFRALLAADADDLQLQQAMAETLLSRGDADSLRQSLALWRTVEKKSAPSSSRWFAAQYAIATINQRLGDPQQAIRLISFLESLYPQMGGPEMKAKFAELRRHCQQAAPKK
jgi:tetratricopeptide (TPR) repeat protein